MRNEVNSSGLKEECGIVGLWDKQGGIAHLCYLSLFALQHRGQEGAGIAVTNGMHIDVEKGLGLMTEAFKEGIPSLEGHCSIGHVRYSTMGGNSLKNVQPIFAYDSNGLLSLAHNGSLTNAHRLRRQLEEQGCHFQSSTDSEVILNLIASSTASTLESRITESLAQVEGAYCLVIMNGDRLIAVRDPYGFRPLCLGRTASGGYIVASESCALDAIDATFERDIAPGEMVVITQEGVSSQWLTRPDIKALCSFEYIYFSRPDSDIDGLNVWQARFRLGEQLAHEHRIDADIVVPVPDTGIAAAIGFSAASGIPYVEGLIKNRYIGRTFILPQQHLRASRVKMKLSPVKANVRGKRVVLIDDSIVRGTTSGRIIAMLYEAGAKEVHMCVSSPPITDPCYYGVDTSVRSELIAANHSVAEIAQTIGATSLNYLSLKGLHHALQDDKGSNLCVSCFCGRYPTDVSECQSELHKESLTVIPTKEVL